jgi:hypothetical protein
MRNFLSITTFTMASLSLFACGAPPVDGAGEAEPGAAAAAETPLSVSAAVETERATPASITSCKQQCASMDDSHNTKVCLCHCNHGTNCGYYW